MRFKLFILLTLLCGLSFADGNKHTYPEPSTVKTTQNQAADLKYPGYCEIEIVNNSFTNVKVSGYFDDGERLSTFRVYAHEYPHYISLYYYGYCHYGMDLRIKTFSGYTIYSGYTERNQTIYITPYLMANEPKYEIKAK
ncbi:MAG: hypothetical protein P1U74_06340 [Legionellaceae bacterium]|nr:hypothetical protein [Legionellaceae bacterium]